MKIKYFVGIPHQKIHSKFYHDLLGGDYVSFECDYRQKTFPDSVFEHDGKNVIWFFNDVYLNLHPRLQGRQILTGHGLGFGRFMMPERAECINKYLDAVFVSGKVNEDYRLEAGVNAERLRPCGYTYPFLIPSIPVQENAVLFGATYFKNWNVYKALKKILQQLDPDLKGYLTLHPQTPKSIKQPFIRLCEEKNNLTYIENQEDLLRAMAVCPVAVMAASSSVAASFWFLGKPVIFLRGFMGFNFFKPIGWERIRRKINYPLFDKVLRESTKISAPRQFNKKLLKQARGSPASKQMFYPWNFDREAMTKRILELMQEWS